jgi:hypothetical protein
MTATYDDRKEQYNKFTSFDSISYNCISYLMQNNETIFKLLKYTSPDAWNKSNLTQAQKGALIYNGGNIGNARIFLDQGLDDAITEEICILRVSPLDLDPTNYIYGNVVIGFEVYAHYKTNHLNNYKTRLDMITQQIIETFNGSDVGNGIGRLYFDSYRNPKCRTRTIGSIPFKGKATTMCNWIL